MRIFNLLIDFLPSFIEQCLVDITVTEEKGEIELLLTPLTRNKHIFPHVISQKKPLDKGLFEIFFRSINTDFLFSMHTRERFGIDGISVSVHLKDTQRSNSFDCWSPRKETEPNEHQLIEAIFELVRQHFQEEIFQNYFEQLKIYFDFGLPAEI